MGPANVCRKARGFLVKGVTARIMGEKLQKDVKAPLEITEFGTWSHGTHLTMCWEYQQPEKPTGDGSPRPLGMLQKFQSSISSNSQGDEWWQKRNLFHPVQPLCFLVTEEDSAEAPGSHCHSYLHQPPLLRSWTARVGMGREGSICEPGSGNTFLRSQDQGALNDYTGWSLEF